MNEYKNVSEARCVQAARQVGRPGNLQVHTYTHTHTHTHRRGKEYMTQPAEGETGIEVFIKDEACLTRRGDPS